MTLDLPPRLAARVERLADDLGVSAEVAALAALDGALYRSKPTNPRKEVQVGLTFQVRDALHAEAIRERKTVSAMALLFLRAALAAEWPAPVDDRVRGVIPIKLYVPRHVWWAIWHRTDGSPAPWIRSVLTQMTEEDVDECS